MLRGFGTLAGLVLALCGKSAVVAAATASIAIGDLTFNHDTGFWRIERSGDGLVATCVQPDCGGAVIDISRHEGEEACTKEAMSAEVDRLFPDAGRAYANVVRAGRFALVLAQRHAGDALSSPEFAIGCVAWQGSEYRFAMRPETVGTQSRVGSALHYLVGTATAPDPVVETVRIGAADFRVSTEVWRISVAPDGETVLLGCRAPTCHEPMPLVALSSRSPARACATGFGGIEERGPEETSYSTLPAEAPDGLAFTIAKTYLGCRNYVPPDVQACAVHGDRSYHLSLAGPAGCRSSSWSVPAEVLAELLQSARIVR
ncbi:hypothetical protein [Oricola sp.]|uniref:hypothetical protein n=1 Tax=Oricola sp. TaxID=1979950 RepID=UPI0025EDC5AF|nr:hypothetical protein [Oricola sp.]MCI5074639.1 hypothetical protein [Oricola sp.]